MLWHTHEIVIVEHTVKQQVSHQVRGGNDVMSMLAKTSVVVCDIPCACESAPNTASTSKNALYIALCMDTNDPKHRCNSWSVCANNQLFKFWQGSTESRRTKSPAVFRVSQQHYIDINTSLSHILTNCALWRQDDAEVSCRVSCMLCGTQSAPI
eukprot:m.263804 g.263804  ORF g.263804 m.263804 type:complete len:154 (+) comp15606_c0_seq1:2642-3103(+)